MKKKNYSALSWDLQLAKSVWRGISVLSVFGLAYSVLGASFALVSKNVIDSAVAMASGGAGAELLKMCLLLAFLIFLQLVMQIVVSELTVRVNGRLNIECKRRLFSSLLHKEASGVLQYH